MADRLLDLRERDAGNGVVDEAIVAGQVEGGDDGGAEVIILGQTGLNGPFGEQGVRIEFRSPSRARAGTYWRHLVLQCFGSIAPGGG